MSKGITDQANNNSITTKSRNWVAVCWIENMVENWQDKLDLTIQYPYVYCIHDKDIDLVGQPRKPHVHIMISFSNTTTYNHALSVYNKLSKNGVKCANTAYNVMNIRYMYNYLIHDTEAARKENKHQYSAKERIDGNNFDIGLLEQVSIIDKKKMLMEISQDIISSCITNYADLYQYVITNYDMAYLDIVYGYSGHFDRLSKGVYLKLKAEDERASHKG